MSGEKYVLNIFAVPAFIFLVIGSNWVEARAQSYEQRYPPLIADSAAIFTQLVEKEALTIHCGVQAQQARESVFGVEKIEQERVATGVYRRCMESALAYGCSASIRAVRNAQIFFNQYYRKGTPLDASAPGKTWARRCGRMQEYSNLNFEADLISECKKSESLLLPPVLLHQLSPFATYGWGGQQIQNAAQKLECRNTTLILLYQGFRCRVLMGERSGISSREHKLSDVDWDICRVLGQGHLATPYSPSAQSK